MLIYVCGPLGLEKAQEIYEENSTLIDSRFPKFFVNEFKKIADEQSAKELKKEIEAFCREHPGSYAVQITDTGLYGALWEMGKAMGCGMEVILEAIPVRQEIVEILELFEESPYECPSKGSYLLGAEGGESIEGAVLIGKCKIQKARLIKDAQGERFLTPPARQKKDLMDRDSHKIIK